MIKLRAVTVLVAAFISFLMIPASRAGPTPRYELARCVVEGIKANQLPLAKLLVTDVAVFDPAHPDPVDQFHMPSSSQRDVTKPDGN